MKPLPPLLNYLVRAVRRTYNSVELFELLLGRGDHAVVLSPEREAHISALDLEPEALPLLDAVDRKRSLPQILSSAEAESPEQYHLALALFYTLGEARIVELI